MPFGWVAGPLKSRDAVYLSPRGRSSEKSGRCLGPKGPGSPLSDQSRSCTPAGGQAEKKTNVKFRCSDVHWVRHHSHVASLPAEVFRRGCIATPAANCEPCHQTSDQGHPDDAPDDAPRDSASIRVTLGGRRCGRGCLRRNNRLVAGRARDIGSAASNFGRICDKANDA
jgi:hypothetical protein